MSEALVWPVAVSVYLGGFVAAARLLYASGWKGASPDPVTKGESLTFSVAWPVWVTLLYLGKILRAGWRLALHLVLGDL